MNIKYSTIQVLMCTICFKQDKLKVGHTPAPMVRKSTWRSSGAQTSDHKLRTCKGESKVRSNGASPFDGNWDTVLVFRNVVTMALLPICISHWIQGNRKQKHHAFAMKSISKLQVSRHGAPKEICQN